MRRPLADLRSRVRIDNPDEDIDQRGLFSVAFPRDYRRSGRFYVDYVDRAGHQRVDELRRGSRRVRAVLDLGPAGTRHHGGQLQFGPDGRLYVSTGMDTGRHPARCCGSTRGGRPRGRRSTRPACATRGASPSTARTGALLIGDVGDDDRRGGQRARARRARPAPTSAGRSSRATSAAARATGPGTSRRRSSCATTTAGARSPAATSSATRACARSPGATCSPTSAPAGCGAPRSRATTLRDARPLGVTAPYPASFGQDARGRVYVVGFGGEVLRLRRR